MKKIWNFLRKYILPNTYLLWVVLWALFTLFDGIKQNPGWQFDAIMTIVFAFCYAREMHNKDYYSQAETPEIAVEQLP